MERKQCIRVKQFGNVLQIILEIPWQEVHGQNQWKAYLEQKTVEAQPPSTYWNDLKTKIIQTFNRTNNVSATAKLCKCSYYTANDIIRKEKSKENRDRRQSAINEAKNLSAAQMPTRDIARIMGKSPETIRLWLKS
ncbi:hypothetical protein HAP94_20325 [Acidithiobacillus ferrivorans]|nr:hypothetical protein [Acidithiobacillus ferrivorans]